MENWSQPEAAFTWSGSAASLVGTASAFCQRHRAGLVEPTLDFVVVSAGSEKEKRE